MRYLIIGDLHGKQPKLHYKNYDAIICPGDIMGDRSRPYVRKAFFHWLKTKEDVDWVDMVGKDKAKELLRKSAEDGRKILERLNKIGKPVYVVPGNWDQAREEFRKWGYTPWERALRGLKNVHDCHETLITGEEHQFIGYGLFSAPEIPQTKAERAKYTSEKLKQMKDRYDKYYKILAKQFKKAKKPVIFMPHNMPYGTLDTIVDEKNPRHGQHMGSVVARDIVREFKPFVCVGGHMHEHHAAVKKGGTTIINAGFGAKVNTLLTVEGRKVETEFWDG